MCFAYCQGFCRSNFCQLRCVTCIKIELLRLWFYDFCFVLTFAINWVLKLGKKGVKKMIIITKKPGRLGTIQCERVQNCLALPGHKCPAPSNFSPECPLNLCTSGWLDLTAIFIHTPKIGPQVTLCLSCKILLLLLLLVQGSYGIAQIFSKQENKF